MAGEAGESPSTIRKTITYTRVVHLSQTIHPDIPRWPGDPPVEFQEVARIEPDGYGLRRFSMGEHSGTHMSAPSAFYEAGATVDTYPAESLVAPALVIDICQQAAANPDFALTQSGVQAWEQRHGEIAPGCIVLLYTGWQTRWDRPREYLGHDRTGGLHFPGFGYDAARFWLGERGISGVGIDSPGVESGRDVTFAVSKLVLERRRLVLETWPTWTNCRPAASPWQSACCA